MVQSVSGLADNLVFITGMLYIAVLTQSAIQIAENWLPYSAVYDKPNVDWRYRLNAQAVRCNKEAALNQSPKYVCCFAEMPQNPPLYDGLIMNL